MNIEFNFQDSNIVIQSTNEDSLESICQHFCTKANENYKDINFLYNGNILKEEMNKKIEDIANKLDIERKKVNIIALKELESNTPKEEFIESKNIICPECGEISEIKSEDYRFNILGCKNKHSSNDLEIDEFKKTQLIDISKVICDNCKNITKSSTHKNYFYRCNFCKMNLCPLCKSKHQEDKKEHTIIKYDEKLYICSEHNINYSCYCKNCNMDLCANCLGGHQKHNIISYINLINENNINSINLEESLKTIKTNLEEIKFRWEEFTKKFKENMEYFQKFYSIYENIILNYDPKNQTYQTLNNIIYLKDCYIFKNIKEINNLNDMNFFNEIININYNINTPNINELIINYKIDKNIPKIKLFNQNFVYANKDKCHLIINGIKTELKEKYKITNFNEKNLKVKLIGIKNIKNMNSMFQDCESLLTIPNLWQINTFRFTDFSYMFYGCTSLEELPDISKWNTFNAENFSYIFGYCPKLETIPDISKWNIMNVRNLSGMFYYCTSLKTMPDISKWSTFKVQTVSYLFYWCTSLDLKEIKNISKWDTTSLLYVNQMIKGCPGTFDDQSNFELRKTFGNFFGLFF